MAQALSQRSPVRPPIEELLLTDAVDFNFQYNSECPYFTFVNDEESDDITTITHLEFGRAAHRAAQILRPGRAGVDGQLVAVIAAADTILYQAIVVGLIVAGYIPFPISPRNSPAAVVNLLRTVSCHRILATNVTLKPLTDSVKTEIASTDPEFELLIQEIPSLADIYPRLGHETPNDPFEPYPKALVRPSLDDVAICLHSSGSTGFPKAIYQTHLCLQQWALSPAVIDFRDHEPPLMLSCAALPAFHTLGIYLQVLNPIYGAVPVAVYPPTVTSKELWPIVPSPTNVLDHTRRTKANALIIVPTFLELWSKSAEALNFMKTLQLIGYSGGSLTQKSGDLLVNSGVHIRSSYGLTEVGAWTTITDYQPGDEKEWQYLSFSERAKVRWVDKGNRKFECQYLSWEKHRPMVDNLPDVSGYATSDLFENHPVKKHLWKIIGRIDDVIVLSTGEKIVPAPIEEVISSSPLVSTALLFGRERSEVGVLIELAPSHAINVSDRKQLASVRDILWSIVEEANLAAPTFGHIFKEMILISNKEKPLPRTGKGTVMRKASFDLYKHEINNLYDLAKTQAETVKAPERWSEALVEEWLLELASQISAETITPSVDLFHQGFDSLYATFLRNRIISALRSSPDFTIQGVAQRLTQNVIYSYPTIKGLGAHILGLTNPDSGSIGHRQALIDEMLEKYSSGLGGAQSTAAPTFPPAVVILTGSSGNMGSEILALLLKDAAVGKVYAFNRPSAQSVLGRHRAKFEDKGLDVVLLDHPKLVFLNGEAHLPNLGLDLGLYRELSASVTCIIHNAWRLDFNLSLSSFEPNIRGTRHLIDLALSAVVRPRFIFSSSISAAQSWDRPGVPIPEDVLLDSRVAIGTGYGEAKYVAERLLSKSGLQVSCLRIGQITEGLSTGGWAVTEWFPILVKSSMALGIFPETEGVVSWVPADAVAAAIVEIAYAKEASEPTLNLVHPRPVKWNTMIAAIRNVVNQGRNHECSEIGLGSFDDWFSRLEASAVDFTEAMIEDIPAIKLLEFFRGLLDANRTMGGSERDFREVGGRAQFSTDKMLGASSAIRELCQFDPRDAESWVRYWKSTGFLLT